MNKLSDEWHHVDDPTGTHSLVGQWVIRKWRMKALDSGIQQAAKNMRKAGFPADVAVLILATTPRKK